MLFSSIAETHGAAAGAVVGTGMGTDGLAGLHEVHRAGAHALVQDEVSSVVFGVPGAAVQVGIADLSASLADVTERVVELTQQEEA